MFKKTGIAMALVLVSTLLAGCTAPSDNTDPIELCENAISEAQEAAEGEVCTQQIQEMQCPHDSEFTHTARNGCVISALEEAGWSSAE